MITDDAIGIGATDGGGARASTALPIVRPDPTKEYVAGGDGYTSNLIEGILPTTLDDLTRAIGFRSYDAMMTYPAVFASVMTLKLGIMSGDMQFVETHPVSAGQAEKTPEQQISADVKAFCERLTNRVPDFRSKLFQLLDCVIDGNKIAEIVAQISETGDDKGRIVLKKLSVKKRRSWEFRVDRFMNVVGIQFRDKSGNYILPADKFVVFSWMPKENDPRGRSILRAAYSAWNLAVQLYPQYYKYLKQFAAPSLVGKTAPNAADQIVDGTQITAQQYMVKTMIDLQNGSVLVIPFGAELFPIPPVGAGEPFLNAYAFCNQEIVYGMLLQTRATMEAQHGSKADAGQASNVLDLLVGYGRDMASEVLRDSLYRKFVALNYGQEVADLYTPFVYLGASDPQDTVDRWNALANLYRAGAVTDSIRAEWHALANGPIPDIEADRAASDAAQQKALEIAQANKPAPASNPPQENQTDPNA